MFNVWPFGNRSNVRLHKLQEQVADLSREVLQLQGDLEALRSTVKSVRGYMYAKLGGIPDTADSASGDVARPSTVRAVPQSPNLSDRDKLRAAAGIRPGKPYPHTE